MSIKLIRSYLREHEDGATVSQIAEGISRTPDYVREAMARIPEAQIDRWVKSRGAGGYSPVWCLLIPKHCPRPEK
jgi:hypothetical protein